MIERRRRAAAAAWDLRDGIVLVGAGQPIPIPGRGDPTYPFRAHTEYVYLTDRERPGGVLAFDPDDGWSDFVAPVTDDERLWEGGGASEGLPLPELAGWLERHAGRPLACLGVPYTDGNAALTEWTRHALDAVRRPKNEVELERMRAAERATAAGFCRAARTARARAHGARGADRARGDVPALGRRPARLRHDRRKRAELGRPALPTERAAHGGA